MRKLVVIRLLGNLSIALAAAQLLPFACSFIYGETEITAFALSAGIALLVGLILRKSGTPAASVSVRESFALVTFGWLIAALFGAIPFQLSGTTASFLDAFFESMSGFTTTGATILEDIESVSRGILFWRSFTHWLGGMGIIALFVALMPHLGSGGMNLLKAEVPGPTPERMTPRVAETAKLLWGIYLGFTAVQTAMLMLSGVTAFDSITHAFATMATGGFSTKNASVGGLENSAAEIIIILFMVIAGGNFALYYAALIGNWRDLIKDREYRFYLTLLAVGTLLVAGNLFLKDGIALAASLKKGMFQVVSITTTTGFTTHDFDAWPQLARLIMVFLMLAGGCRGSTGGGPKQIRLMVFFKYGYRELHRALHPRAVVPIKLGKESIGERTVANIIGFVVLYLGVLSAASLALTGMGIDLESAFSASAACLGNVGPGLGIVGPIENYGPLPTSAKATLTFLMLLGRLEIYTVLVLLLPVLSTRRPRFQRLRG